jgi:ankyrin repeat protein
MDSTEAELILAIREGAVATVSRIISERPELASASLAIAKGRTPLHIATDWPGYFPFAPDIVRVLLASGADVNERGPGSKAETPLHWAASTDDVDVAAVLIEGGADLEAPDGSIGTPLDNAIGYGCWQVARLLVARGARVNKLWHAAALGLLARTAELVSNAGQDQVNQAFWHACAGGQRRTAELLLERGADIGWRPDYAGEATLLEVVTGPSTRHDLLATWLRDNGAPQ